MATSAKNKILETDFRNGLYKSLIEAGYDKSEAQHIVGVKYLSELKKSVCEQLSATSEAILNDKFDVKLNAEEINLHIAEMQKMASLLNGVNKEAAKAEA